MGRPSQEHLLNSQLLGDATRRSTTSSTARTGALATGMYTCTSDVDCRIKQGGSGVTVTATTGTQVWAKSTFTLYVDTTTNQYVATIRTGGADGTLELSLIS